MYLNDQKFNEFLHKISIIAHNFKEDNKEFSMILLEVRQELLEMIEEKESKELS